MLDQSQSRAIEHEIPTLRRYAWSLARDPDDADDLVQDSLERAVSRIDQFRPGTNLRAWLFTIVRNRYSDTVRRKQRQGQRIPIEQWEPYAATPARQARRLELRDFWLAYRRLSRIDRQILYLVGVEGLSYEQAADRLDVALGTIKSRLFRARERLRAVEMEMSRPGTSAA